MTRPLAIIVLAPESSGNHLCCTLLSQICIAGEPVMGVDMLGWNGPQVRWHNESPFHTVWQQLADVRSVTGGRSFVTGRSVPCGEDWPPVRWFYEHCESSGYLPRLVLVVRDVNIAQESSRRHGYSLTRCGQPADVRSSWEWLLRETRGLPRWWLSYEALTQIGADYFIPWLANFHSAASIDERWFANITDENAKYVRFPQHTADGTAL